MSLPANYSERTRAAVEDLRSRHTEHARSTGQLPNSREIERRTAECGRRNERRDSERGEGRRRR